MNIVGGLIGCAIGGLIGGAIWTGVSHGTGYEIGWVAWGVGLLCGVGMAIGSKRTAGQVGGLIAAGVAIVAILAAKYVTVELDISTYMSQNPGALTIDPPDVDDRTFWVGLVADGLITERLDAGQEVKWPEGVDPELAERPEEYPPEIWKDAGSRWDSMSADDRTAYCQAVIAELAPAVEEAATSWRQEIAKEGFLASFGVLDIVFGVLAIVTAFKIGSGQTEET